jgi:LysR family glycine cleavage system transcriptional activator
MSQDDLPPLATLRAFAAAGRHESFQAAASELGVTPSAISHQIRALESWIGAPLFERETRQVRLNALGRSLAPALDEAFTRIAEAARAARAGAADTRLRISALPLFTNQWLIPRLDRFKALHPGIVLDIDTSQRLADFDRDEVDVAIRNSETVPTGLAARKLLDVRAVPLCTPALAARIRSPEDLARATLIHISARPDGWRTWLAAIGRPEIKGASDLSFDTVPASLEAAAAGHGVVLGIDPLVWDAPVTRDLVIPFVTSAVSAGAYFIVHRRRDRARVLLRSFIDWILDEMARDARRLRAAGRARAAKA